MTPTGPGSTTQEVYFAAKTGDDLADAINARVKEWDEFLLKSGELKKMQDAAAAYVGEDEKGYSTADVGRNGAQGQLAVLKTNVIRPSVQNVITFTASQPPGIMPVPKNTDHQSNGAALIARGIADHYRDEEEVEEVAKEALETALVLTRGAVSVPWDESAGRERELAPEDELADLLEPEASATPVPMQGETSGTQPPMQGEPSAAEPTPVFQSQREGDSRVRVHEPQDCIFDPRTRSRRSPWRVLRCWENRWEMAAKFPEFAEHILAFRPQSEKVTLRQAWFEDRESRFQDEIPVLELYHDRTPAMPRGKRAFIVGDKAVFEDELRYRDFPVYEIRAGRRFSTAFAHSPTVDVISMSRAIDTLTSIPYSNMRSTGVLTLLEPKGAAIEHKRVTEGLAKISYNGENEPKFMEVPQTPAQFFEYRKDLISESRNQYGLDNFSAGADIAKMSGAAYTMLDSRTLRALQGTVTQWVGCLRFLYNGLLHNLQTFAKGSRKLPMMVGKMRSAFVKDFEAGDIEPIDRYSIEMVSPVMRTPSGRMEVGNSLLAARAANGGPSISVEQYVALIETGKIEPLTEGPMLNLQNIRDENERLLRGEKLDNSPEEEAMFQQAATDPMMAQMLEEQGIERVATVAVLDNDWQHVSEHKAVADSPEARSNPVVMRNLNDHIARHIENARTKDPGLLAILGQPPLPMMAPPMGVGPDGAPAPMPPPGAPATPEGAAPAPGPLNGESTPRAPINPQTGERYEGQPAPTAADIAGQQ